MLLYTVEQKDKKQIVSRREESYIHTVYLLKKEEKLLHCISLQIREVSGLFRLTVTFTSLIRKDLYRRQGKWRRCCLGERIYFICLIISGSTGYSLDNPAFLTSDIRPDTKYPGIIENVGFLLDPVCTLSSVKISYYKSSKVTYLDVHYGKYDPAWVKNPYPTLTDLAVI